MITQYIYEIKGKRKNFILNDYSSNDEERDFIAFDLISQKENCLQDNIILLECFEITEKEGIF